MASGCYPSTHPSKVYLTGLAAGNSVALRSGVKPGDVLLASSSSRLRAWQRQEKSWSAFGNVRSLRWNNPSCFMILEFAVFDEICLGLWKKNPAISSILNKQKHTSPPKKKKQVLVLVLPAKGRSLSGTLCGCDPHKNRCRETVGDLYLHDSAQWCTSSMQSTSICNFICVYIYICSSVYIYIYSIHIYVQLTSINQELIWL